MSVRINGAGPSIPVKSPAAAKTTVAKQTTTAQGTGYSSASSFAGSTGATPEEISQVSDSFNKYIDFSSTEGGKPDTNSDPDHIQLATMGNIFGAVASDTRDRLCNEAKQQVDALLNQQPPLSKEDLDAKVKDVKDSLRQKMELESSLAKMMKDTMQKVKDAGTEAWGSPWGG